MNDTVKCDGGLYKSLQAWKDHKLHIEHEVLIRFSPSFPISHADQWFVLHNKVCVTVYCFLLRLD